MARALVGFPRHLSQHPGGFVIARGRLDEMVPVENAAMDDRTVIQWDKNDVDALGMMKVDVLAIGMLTVIRKALDLLRDHRSLDLDVARIPAECPKVYDMLGRAGFHRRVPGREPGPAIISAAHETALFLRLGDRGSDYPARPDPRRHGASVFAPSRR